MFISSLLLSGLFILLFNKLFGSFNILLGSFNLLSGLLFLLLFGNKLSLIICLLFNFGLGIKLLFFGLTLLFGYY